MSKKRIGIVSHDFYPYQGGLGRHATSLLQELNQSLTGYSFIGISPHTNELTNHTQKLGFTRSLPADQLQFSLFYQFAQNKIVKELQLDALVLNGGPGGVFCLSKPPVPLVYIANHTYQQQSSCVPGQGWKKVFIPIERASYKNATLISSISSTTQKTLLGSYSLPAEKLVTIPPGFSFAESPSFTRDGKDFLFLGRIDERKGLSFLLETIAKHPEVFSESHLHIVGTGSETAKLQSYAIKNKLEKLCTFHGFLPDNKLKSIIAGCRAQIVPSRLEGFGIAAVEAIQNGLPLIATNVDGLVDIVKHEQTGLLIPFGEAEQLADACSYMLKEQHSAEHFAEAAYRDASERFSWNAIAPEYEALFGSLFTH